MLCGSLYLVERLLLSMMIMGWFDVDVVVVCVGMVMVSRVFSSVVVVVCFF